ncbi:MAG TPA: FAD-dependent thymidylate synthase [Anaerolineae bacterium]|nr:FAD-dependent thymidylate synthase [Anaerolineae bacterium]
MVEDHRRRIYILPARELSPEIIAVTFAKTSRSPLSFKQIAAELSAEESARFHEKWVVGYGHRSVAEHAVLHVAFENISRLAVECIESNRLASYTEKSTRYQTWDLDAYHVPDEVIGMRYEDVYRSTCDHLIVCYRRSLDPVASLVRERFPRASDESEQAWDSRIRSRYIDVCRYLLPAAALSNVGMTVNARSLANAIRKMLSHRLEEVRQIGRMVKDVAQHEVPTLLKYLQPVSYWQHMDSDLREQVGNLEAQPQEHALSLFSHDPEGEHHVLAAALFEHASCLYDDAFSRVQKLDQEGRRRLAEALLGKMDRFDAPARSLEHTNYTFAARMDQGAYFELKRHRMMTQTPQQLTDGSGYAVPRLIAEAQIEDEYRQAMKTASHAYQDLASWNPHVAAYVIPNAFNRQVLMTLNLRQAFHFCELRSQPNAHFSIRRIALKMAEMIREVHPMLGSFMRLPEAADWRSVEAEHFCQV